MCSAGGQGGTYSRSTFILLCGREYEVRPTLHRLASDRATSFHGCFLSYTPGFLAFASMQPADWSGVSCSARRKCRHLLFQVLLCGTKAKKVPD